MTKRGPGRPRGSGGQQDGRDAILTATRELLAELGMGNVTLRDVAERAGVRAPLVNYYFGSKADLFEAVMEEVGAGLRDRSKQIAALDGPPEERFKAFVVGMIRGMADDPYGARLVIELAIFPDDERTDRFIRVIGRPNIDALKKILTDGVESGAFRPFDPRLLVPALMGSCLFYFLGAPGLRRLMDFEPTDPEMVERYAEFTSEMILGAISAAPGGES